MANIKSSLKDIRRIKRRSDRNRQVRSKLKTLQRQVRESEVGTEEGRTAAIRYISAVDKAAKGGVVHGNRANRQKAICAKYLAGTAPEAVAEAES